MEEDLEDVEKGACEDRPGLGGTRVSSMAADVRFVMLVNAVMVVVDLGKGSAEKEEEEEGEEGTVRVEPSFRCTTLRLARKRRPREARLGRARVACGMCTGLWGWGLRRRSP